MLDLVRQATAGLLEAPEQALNLTGQALEAMGNMLEEISKRIDDLEALIRGQGSGDPSDPQAG